jgi:hypothetical protein
MPMNLENTLSCGRVAQMALGRALIAGLCSAPERSLRSLMECFFCHQTIISSEIQFVNSRFISLSEKCPSFGWQILLIACQRQILLENQEV